MRASPGVLSQDVRNGADVASVESLTNLVRAPLHSHHEQSDADGTQDTADIINFAKDLPRRPCLLSYWIVIAEQDQN